jgi:flagellar biosynthesis protein FliQ
MDEGLVMSYAMNALLVTIYIVSPILLVSLVVGGLVSLVQAATQVNEITLTFVPKIIGIILVIVILGSWMLQQMVTFMTNVLTSLPNLVN